MIWPEVEEQTKVHPAESIRWGSLLNTSGVVLVAVVLSRIPFLGLGYGADDDAWRVAHSAVRFWKTGIYAPSRFPGFPLYEILNAPLIGIGGSVLSNCATVAVFCCAVLLFRKLLRMLKTPNGDILVWSFAFLPLLWKNSAVTMDYCWGLALILAGYILFLDGKQLAAAAIIGLAATTRITHVIFLIPLLFLPAGKNGFRIYISMALVAAGVIVAGYLPVVLKPNVPAWTEITFASARPYPFLRTIAIFAYRGTYALGLAAVAALVIYSFLNRKSIARVIGSRDNYLVAWLSAIALNIALFAVLPDEREYLIPMIPFLLVAAGTMFPRKQLAVIMICFVSYNVVSFDVIAHDFNREEVRPAVTNGLLVGDYVRRRDQAAWRTAVAAYPFKDSSVVMIAGGPDFALENPLVHCDDEVRLLFQSAEPGTVREVLKTFPDKFPARSVQRNVIFVYMLDGKECEAARRAGYHIYYLKHLKDYLQYRVPYNLDSVADPVDVRWN